MTAHPTFTSAATRLQERQAKALADSRGTFVKLVRDSDAKVVKGQIARAGIAPGSKMLVDGEAGRPLERVKIPGGIVRIDYDYRWEAALRLREILQRNSPVESGEYRASHVILIDGQEVTPGRTSPTLAPRAELIVVNTTPYSRRLEVGTKRAGRPFVIDVEPRIYERSAREAKATLGKLARFRPTYIRLAGGYRLKETNGRNQQAGSEITYPAVIISPIK